MGVRLQETVIVAVSALSINVSDSIGINENVEARVAGHEINVSDSVGINEVAAISLDDLTVNVNDPLAFQELVGAELPDPLEINASDNFSVSESVQADQPLEVNVVDSLRVAESPIVRLISLESSPSDNLGLSESVSITLDDLTISTIDTIGISEDVTVEVTAAPDPQISVVDNFGLSESVQAALDDLAISKADQISFTELTNVEVESSPPLTINVSDQLSISESIDLSLDDLTISKSDIIGVSEAVDLLIDLNPSVVDAIAIEESVTAGVEDKPALAISVEDQLSISELVGSSLDDLRISTNDQLTLSESVTVDVSVLPGGDLNIGVADQVAFSESISAAVSELDLSVADSFSFSEDTTVELGAQAPLEISVIDNLAIREAHLNDFDLEIQFDGGDFMSFQGASTAPFVDFQFDVRAPTQSVGSRNTCFYFQNSANTEYIQIELYWYATDQWRFRVHDHTGLKLSYGSSIGDFWIGESSGVGARFQINSSNQVRLWVFGSGWTSYVNTAITLSTLTGARMGTQNPQANWMPNGSRIRNVRGITYNMFTPYEAFENEAEINDTLFQIDDLGDALKFAGLGSPFSQAGESQRPTLIGRSNYQYHVRLDSDVSVNDSFSISELNSSYIGLDVSVGDSISLAESSTVGVYIEKDISINMELEFHKTHTSELTYKKGISSGIEFKKHIKSELTIKD